MKLNDRRRAEQRFAQALQRQTGILASKHAGEHSFAYRRVRNLGIDITWITDRIALGGGIWNPENMAELTRMGITHIIDMQIEFDDTPLAEPHGIQVLWNATDDDFQPKPPELFERGVEFAAEALDQAGSKLFIHCAAGVHRAAMMTLGVLCSMGWEMGDAMETISSRRPVVDFADVYVNSVQNFLQEQVRAETELS
ncbi:MAG TPA: dual specificity protein phosphatase [Terriglobales bacterium]|nr:dual specificity protein phosphatase [Terriglobales bacterium]